MKIRKLVDTVPQAIRPDPAQSSEIVEESARDIKRSADATRRSADLTTILAADRTLLAAERTYAAWIRTGLAALLSGVGAQAFLLDVLPPWVVSVTGSLLIVFSALCFVTAVWRGLKQPTPIYAAQVKKIPPALLVGIGAVLLVIDVTALIGIWISRSGVGH